MGHSVIIKVRGRLFRDPFGGAVPPRAPPSEYRDYYALGLITIPNMNANWPPASPLPRFPSIRVAVAGPRLFRVAY